jgi:hypothetical protein
LKQLQRFSRRLRLLLLQNISGCHLQLYGIEHSADLYFGKINHFITQVESKPAFNDCRGR